MRRSALDSDKWGRWRPLVVVGGADGGPGQRRLGWGQRDSMHGEDNRGPGRCDSMGRLGSLVDGSGAVGPSGRQCQGSQSSQGAAELGSPGPMLGQMQSEAAGRAGEPSGQGEEAPPEGLGGHHLLAQTDARCPAGEVVGHHLYRQPGGVGGEAARGEMVQPHTVLEVSDGILDLGVAAMVGLQFEHLPVPVSDEAVIAVGGEEGQLGTGRGLHTPDDEPHRCGVRFTLEGSAEPVSKVSGKSRCKLWATLTKVLRRCRFETWIVSRCGCCRRLSLWKALQVVSATSAAPSIQ